VVASGIAEALFATVIGLVAAIPAVMAYNKFATEFSNYSSCVQAIIGTYGAGSQGRVRKGLESWLYTSWNRVGPSKRRAAICIP
jgi:hypothetical protein